MRLVNKDNIKNLNYENTIELWKECKRTARQIRYYGIIWDMENSFVLNYSYLHLLKYSYLVANKLKQEGYQFEENEIEEFESNVLASTEKYAPVTDAVTNENLFC